jgi:hypothetical protein
MRLQSTHNLSILIICNFRIMKMVRFIILFNPLGIYFMKDHLNCRFALFMLLGAALGTGFLSLPYAVQKFPGESNFIFILNIHSALGIMTFYYLSGMFSCYLLIETCIITNLESFQELVHFFGGGRAGVLFITTLQIIVYSMMPIVFMCKTNKDLTKS